MAVQKFLSCDWGTSHFRLRLIETATLSIIAEQTSQQGIANTFELYKQSKIDDKGRLSFYLNIISDHVLLLEEKLAITLHDIPLIISGMASSSIGMMELPYKHLPFFIDGSDLIIQRISTDHQFPYQIFCISGVRSTNDVMRGEETQLIGSIEERSDEEDLYIFPGTHSKHILIKNDKAVGFETYMTGEFFQLLSQRSILSASVEEGEGLQDERNRQSFERAVIDSNSINLLHSSFLVRTNILFAKYSRQENYYYLSGLLIGSELKDILHQAPPHITLVADSVLRSYYEAALKVIFDLAKKDLRLKILSSDEGLFRGQWKIFNSQYR
jgi:2-dehydro-3-deoxygalactonokinase